jgi:glycosyltransferase involved in cell wall biosynthesis
MAEMNILQVVESCGAGVGRHVRGLCEGLVAAGHRVTVAYAPYRADAAFRQFIATQRNHIDFVPLKLRREISPRSDLASLAQLRRSIKHKGPFDVIHGHSSKGGAIARLAGRLSGIPTVYTPHSLIMSSSEISGAKRTAYTLVERILGACATSKMIAVSEDERDFILRLRLVPNKRVALIYNGIDDQTFAYFSGLSGGHHRATDERPLTFGSIMRFSAQKAPGHLLEAFVQLARRLPQVPLRLVVAGDGELLAEVKGQAQASGMGDKISLLGWRTDVATVLHGYDVFVLPSLYEGLSYVILEAMAAGLPIVSTDVFGTKETAAQVLGNVIVPAGDPAALARGMQRMVNPVSHGTSRKALQEIGQANQDYVHSHFRQGESVRCTLRIYQELRWREENIS